MVGESNQGRQRILLVTGMLGAGKSTALRELEDLGWEAIDNFPVRLLGRLVGTDGGDQSLAIGFDCRTRGFVPNEIIERVKKLEARDDVSVTAVFLDCAGHEAAGGSILGLMMLGAAKGDTVCVAVKGRGAEARLAELVAMIESGFGED